MAPRPGWCSGGPPFSGVLAVVTTGVLGRKSPYITSSGTRLQGFGTWELITFLLNGLIFILIGLSSGEWSTTSTSFTAGRAGYLVPSLVSVTVVVVRVIWVFPATYVPRWVSRSLRERDPAPSWRSISRGPCRRPWFRLRSCSAGYSSSRCSVIQLSEVGLLGFGVGRVTTSSSAGRLLPDGLVVLRLRDRVLLEHPLEDQVAPRPRGLPVRGCKRSFTARRGDHAGEERGLVRRHVDRLAA